MKEQTGLMMDELADAPIMETIEHGPDSYVDLHYEDHKNPEYVRVTARNHHPDKAIHAYFYVMREKGGIFVPAEISDSTINTCLKPSQATVVHFGEKRHNPRLFLFNAIYESLD